MWNSQVQSQGEDSNSSDTEPSDRGDGNENGGMDSLNGSHSFPSAFLGLQGLLPGPSGMHGANDFGELFFKKSMFPSNILFCFALSFIILHKIM